MTSCSGNIRRGCLPDRTDDKDNSVTMAAANWIFRKSVCMRTSPWNFAQGRHSAAEIEEFGPEEVKATPPKKAI
jgi:hypothetical protein